ncbi:MAG: excinuclease ABC subunit UvrC [Firmicutes bacterium]|nr:excinuclease ABC subunit UvrC [Bacillota bacterium]
MFDIKEELKKLPSTPGVYIMKSENDEIIYIGKAINLKNRVKQYFTGTKSRGAKTIALVSHIKEFEYIITDSEMEALILECNLIKKHKPKYNIMLKDDKKYPYIKVTVNEDFPVIYKTRRRLDDGALYIGPITDATAVNETIDMIHKIWPIRKCRKKLPRDIGRERPCLNYHIGECEAPCAGLISKEEYGEYVKEAVRLLSGHPEELVKKLKAEMAEASKNLEFEKAASLRDKIKWINRIGEKQKMENTSVGDADVIAMKLAEGEGLFQIFFMRGGKLVGREHFFAENIIEETKGEAIAEFIKRFYSGTAFVPKEIVVEDIPDSEHELLEDWLSGLKGVKVKVIKPVKGEKEGLLKLAATNAEIVFNQFGEKLKKDEARTIGAVKELCDILGLETPVSRIEAYDISNIMGTNSVGSMVVFEDGSAKRSDYRKFKIKSVNGANDYASMQEVLVRRFNHAIKEGMTSELNKAKFSKLPDLMLMDGGKIQVNAAKEVLMEFGLDIPVCGMVKDDRHRTRAFYYEDKEINVDKSSQSFRLVTRIQDEAHRFAIEYHRRLREKNEVHSILDDIPKIGEKRRKALLYKFGDVESIREASLEELESAENMTKDSALEVYKFFHE